MFLVAGKLMVRIVYMNDLPVKMIRSCLLQDRLSPRQCAGGIVGSKKSQMNLEGSGKEDYLFSPFFLLFPPDIL